MSTLIEINSESELVKLKVHSLGECDLSERGRGRGGGWRDVDTSTISSKSSG